MRTALKHANHRYVEPISWQTEGEFGELTFGPTESKLADYERYSDSSRRFPPMAARHAASRRTAAGVNALTA